MKLFSGTPQYRKPQRELLGWSGARLGSSRLARLGINGATRVNVRSAGRPAGGDMILSYGPPDNEERNR